MENFKSIPVTNLDAQPIIVATVGEGAPGRLNAAQDFVSPTAAASARWSTYRLCRFPTNAKIKRVHEYISGVDTNATATGTYDFNVAFSDSTTDGTPASLQGAIPSNKLDGTAFGFVASTGYSTAYVTSGTGNKLFGNVAGANSGTAPTKYTDITFNGANFTPAMAQDDVWDLLGFTNAQGLAQDPGGKMDIFVVVAANLATAANGTIAVELDYIV